jgi:hypothetical protein
MLYGVGLQNSFAFPIRGRVAWWISVVLRALLCWNLEMTAQYLVWLLPLTWKFVSGIRRRCRLRCGFNILLLSKFGWADWNYGRCKTDGLLKRLNPLSQNLLALNRSRHLFRQTGSSTAGGVLPQASAFGFATVRTGGDMAGRAGLWAWRRTHIAGSFFQNRQLNVEGWRPHNNQVQL